MFADLASSGDIAYNYRHTITVPYDEIAFGRWLETQFDRAGMSPVPGASILDVAIEGGDLRAVVFATRYGPLRVRAGFVPRRERRRCAGLGGRAGVPGPGADRPGFTAGPAGRPGPESATRGRSACRLAEKADEYGLLRRDGLAFFFPGTGHRRDEHDSRGGAPDGDRSDRAQLRGGSRRTGWSTSCASSSRWRSGGAPSGRTVSPGAGRPAGSPPSTSSPSTRSATGIRFADAVARTAWPIELHDRPAGYAWDVFDSGPRPLRPAAQPHLTARHGEPARGGPLRRRRRGRPVERPGDGPCSAMGEAAAHALDLTLMAIPSHDDPPGRAA